MYYATSQDSFPEGKTIPEQTTHFFLSDYYLADNSDEERLVNIISTAPKTLKYFSLKIPTVNQSLDPVDIIFQALSRLKPSVETLDIDAPLKFLTRRDIGDTITASSFDDLPEHITTLRLSCSYDYSNINTLTQLFLRIPKSVKKIILSFGYLPPKEKEEIERSLKHMADKRENDCSFGLEWQYKAHTIEKLLFQIKSIGEEKVTSLILSNSTFGTYGHTELCSGITSIPSSITSVVLPKNFMQSSADELTAFFNELPSSVTEIDCIKSSLEQGKTGAELKDKINTALSPDRTLNFINLRIESNHIIHYRHEAAPVLEQKEGVIDHDDVNEEKQANHLDPKVKKAVHFNLDANQFIEPESKPEPELEPELELELEPELELEQLEKKVSEKDLQTPYQNISPTLTNKQNQFFPPSPPEESVSHDDTPRHSASLQFMLSIINAPPAQLAVLALGVTLILACSGAGLLALGAALTVFGGIGLTKSAYDALSTPSDTENTEHKPT